MKRYYVSVTETLNKVVSVDAESEAEAVSAVNDAYHNCEIVLDSDDFIGEQVQVESDQQFYAEVYDAVHEFNKKRKHLAWETKQSDAFINAYKGSGSYYTMRNLIMFHGARFWKNGRKMSEANSLKELESKAKLYDEQGWRMLGVLKQLIIENDIDIQGKINEWHKDKVEKVIASK